MGYLCWILIADNTPTGDTGLASLDYKSHYDYAEEAMEENHSDLRYVNMDIKDPVPTVKVIMQNSEVFFSCEVPEDLVRNNKR